MFVPVTNQPPPTRIEWVRLSNGYTVYYRRAGRGPSVLLVHGWGGSSRYWQDTITFLSSFRTVYAIDLPGYGQSPPMIVEPATPERLSRLVLEFVDAMRLEQFDIVGHSLGASLACYAAAGWPDRINRVVLTCVGSYRNKYERHLIRVMHRLVVMWLRLRQPWMLRVPFFYRRIARNFFYQLPEDEVLLRECVSDFLNMDRQTAKDSAIGMVGHTLISVLKQIRVPTLVIGATNDRLTPKYGPPSVVKLIPKSRLSWIEQCGHLPMLEQPEVFHGLLSDFLTEELSEMDQEQVLDQPILEGVL